MLDKDYLLREYQVFKDRANIAFQKNEIDNSLNLLLYCGYIAWYYPILYRFIDEELEQLLDNLAGKIIARDPENNGRGLNKQRVVLYAGQLIDNGALTEQYLHYFIDNNYEVLVVVPSAKNVVLGRNTLKLIEATPGVEIYMPAGHTLSNKIKLIHKKVRDFDPGVIFLHFLPNDVVGYCVFAKVNHVTRYYIVHNDHTFWLGKGCADFFLEFRQFGYLLSHLRRQIPQEKLLCLPYYPINNNVDFQGFPFVKDDKVIGLSGANLYKYLLDPQLRYLHTIKLLLRRNPNFVFCLCGHGDGIDKIKEVFKDKDIIDRFFYLGKREDFYSLVGNIDILFESYPLKGGLTFLFALNQGKALIGMGNPNDVSGSIQDVIDLNGYHEPVEFDDFLEEADQLIKDPKVRQRKVERVSGHKYNKKDFNDGLTSILDNNLCGHKQNTNAPLRLDDKVYLDNYLNLANSEALLRRNKLYILKSSISISERVRELVRFSLANRHPLTVKEIARLGFLTLFGK